MIWQDLYVCMARGPAATTTVSFGTALTNPITRHFTTTASGHATLASMHSGRVVLGIGRGDSSATLARPPELRRELAHTGRRLPSTDGGYDYYGGHCTDEAEHVQWIPDEVIDGFALAGRVGHELIPRIAADPTRTVCSPSAQGTAPSSVRHDKRFAS